MRLLELELKTTACTARLPFRFGKVTMDEAPLLTARVRVGGTGGAEVFGFAGDLLVPKWFRKSEATTVAEDQAALLASAKAAGERWKSAPSEEPLFSQWLAVQRDLVESVPPEAEDRLVRGFGVALVERAMMDAVCREAGLSFFEAWRTNLFGMQAGLVDEGLADFDPAKTFARPPLEQVRVRHTVGMLDPLTEDAVPRELRRDDRHPCSLEEDIAAYGLDAFKVKVGGDPDADLDRLDAVGRVIAKRAPGSLVTLDGNEQYPEPGRLAQVLATLRDRPGGPAILDHLAHVEQPAPRALTYEPGQRAGLSRLSEFAPVIVDEADYGLGAFRRARGIGYAGISVKNCKGVFRAVLNGALASRLGEDAFLSGEDLTNLPVLPLQQDLATAALLHLPHVERNGHHYFPGLDHVGPAAAVSALAAHPDLYRRTQAGAALRIEGGRVRTGSLDCPGYGYASKIPWPA